MDDQTIKDIVAEIAPLLEGRAPGKVFQLSPLSLAIDFHSRDKKYLFISADPNGPRLYLMARRVSELEKRSQGLTPFALALRSELSHTRLQSITKDEGDRIVRFMFAGRDDLGEKISRTLIAQLTGRAANLLILDEAGIILRALRSGRGPRQPLADTAGPNVGQAVGQVYEGPRSFSGSRARRESEPLIRGPFASLSEAADAHYRNLDETQASTARAAAARAHLRKQISQGQRLLKQLERDLSTHANSAEDKRIGDLLIANISTAKRRGDQVQLIDYFADGAPEVEVEVDRNSSLQQEAARRFAKYTKSKRATRKITGRITAIKTELEKLEERRQTLEQIIAAGNEADLDSFTGARSRGRSEPRHVGVAGGPKPRKPEQKIPGVRRYLSTDGYEILVGRAARDNDHLTFKVAKPYDLWLHAADYPGSHVVVRNPTRKEIPHRTIIEAAQLTAYFCQARKDSKVSVHYTQRKFLSKPKGAAPGLVRMSSFKNINAEPKESIERI